MRPILLLFALLLAACGTPTAPALRATLVPYPTNAPATPGPTPTPPPAYPAPAPGQRLQAEAAPHFSAFWDGPISATVQWSQVARGCLAVAHATGERVFIGCYERFPATIVLELGHGPTDGTARPAAGDVFVLQTGGQTERTPLIARPLYLARVQR